MKGIHKSDHIVVAANSCWYVYNFQRPVVRALVHKGWKVTVLAPRDQYSSRLVESGAAHRHIELEPTGMNLGRELGSIEKYKTAYRELRPAVALQHTIKPDIYGSIAARSAGIPVVNTVAGLGRMFSGGLKETMIRALYRYALASAEITFFLNSDDRAVFLRHHLVKQARTALLPGPGVDTELFRPQPRGPGPFTFLLLGRLLRAKGVEDFVESARTVKTRYGGCRFLLLGSIDPGDPEYVDPGALARAVQEGVVERKDHVDDVRPIIASADCIVLPSYYREGVPRSLLEAASMGKPLIAADSVGTREPVRDGRNGFLCRPRDPADLAAKMEAMLTMPRERREAMGAESRASMIERFDESFVVASYLEAVERLATLPGKDL